ncbi:MAG: DUF1538 domain-containing protein [Cyclobacteriaceae bacterium]|nr:DUF1538 domain-containing protein [Cyclobacteriaceae bacterium]
MIIRRAQVILNKLKEAFIDLLPIILVVSFFQIFVLKQPFPNIGDVLFGSFLVVLGLMLFVEGLEMSLFPIGEVLAQSLARKGSLFWLLLFSFALGFSTSIAEPALIAVADEAGRIASIEGLIGESPSEIESYALGLRLSVAFAVGTAILIGVIRILKGWPLHFLIISGYGVVMILTILAPEQIIGIAYDTGGVATSTITVPLVTALGVGLASTIKGRNPLTDGFGLIALAVMMPMIFVMIYGMLIF